MMPLRQIAGRAISLPDPDIDTDIIYPARFLLITDKRGLGRYAFHDRRGAPGFPFGTTGDEGAAILVAGRNFGCGSSREQAPWALADLGIRVIIAPSFGEIFYWNCFKNGLLAIILPSNVVSRLHMIVSEDAWATVDLDACTIELPSLGAISFDIATDHRESLLNGWDETARIRALHGDDITRFEDAQRRSSPWLWTKDDIDA